MLFNSFEFIFLFLPIVLITCFFLRDNSRFIVAFLTLMSLVFYSYWSIEYVPLLMGSILFNYFMGKVLERSRRRLYLIMGVAGNLLLLAYFKYTDFFLGTHFNIILPLGISFYTFTQTAYLVDAYRGEAKGNDLLTYSLFVSIFPHLIAGPIIQHNKIIPQFGRIRFTPGLFQKGLFIFILGLGKKVLIADSLIQYVKPVFDNPSQAGIIQAWSGALFYTFQLYFDFSGYSDMAVGLGLMLSIKFPINFNSPYKSTSIIEFWRRWHITLSNFIRAYLYIPLRSTRLPKYLSLLVVMLLVGLWHGAGWTYVAWGAWHGACLSINHMWKKSGIQIPRPFGWLLTFLCVVVGWVLFRAHSLTDAVTIIRGMFGYNGLGAIGKRHALSILFLLVCTLKLPNVHQITFKPIKAYGLGLGIVTALCLLMLNRVTEFLYFQF